MLGKLLFCIFIVVLDNCEYDIGLNVEGVCGVVIRIVFLVLN